jgi:hypothetical protein
MTTTDFKTWKRPTLEQFAVEVSEENKVLKELVKSFQKAWKDEIKRNEGIHSANKLPTNR